MQSSAQVLCLGWNLMPGWQLRHCTRVGPEHVWHDSWHSLHRPPSWYVLLLHEGTHTLHTNTSTVTASFWRKEKKKKEEKKIGGGEGGGEGAVRVNFLCWLFWYPSQPCVITVARKKIPVILPKVQVSRLQLNTHVPYICGFERNDTINGCMVVWCSQTCTETAAVSHGTSRVTTR